MPRRSTHSFRTLTIWLLSSVSNFLFLLLFEFIFMKIFQKKKLDGKDDDDSNQVIEELEKIDDDCDKHGIQFVKIDDKAANKEHGVKDVRKILKFIFEIF